MEQSRHSTLVWQERSLCSRWVGLLLLVLFCTLFSACSDQTDPNYPGIITTTPVNARHPYDWCKHLYTDKYDDLFRREVALQIHWDTHNWCRYKQQAFAESSLNPLAISPEDAKGLMQLIDGTFNRWTDCNNVWDPACNVRTGLRYVRWLQTQWYLDRPAACRADLVAASYNWGLGNLLHEQVRTGNQLCITADWRLPLETQTYTQRVNYVKTDTSDYSTGGSVDLDDSTGP